VKAEVRSPKSEVCRPLVCFALKEEAQAFQELAAGRPDVAVLITGMGRENSRRALHEHLAQGTPSFVLTCGFAGGLDPGLRLGEVLFATEDDVLRARLLAANAKPAKFLCAERIATTVGEKDKLRRTAGADAVEMESAAYAEVCRERGIRYASVRAISDAAHDTLPLDFNRLSNPDQSLNFGKLAWELAKSPGKIPALLRLQRNSSAAAVRLAKVLLQVVGPTPAD
jgi:adenosylhomocysteine nucleosidase